MKHLSTFLFFIYILIFPVSAQNLTLNDINSGKYAQRSYPQPISSEDGEYYYKLNDDRTQIGKYNYKTGKLETVLFDTKTARENELKNIQSFLVGPNEKHIIIYDQIEPLYRRSKKSVLYDFDVKRNLIKRLTHNSEKQSEPKFSKDGRMLAYIADNNIWLVKFDYDTESQITNDGEINNILNGQTDWVYEEEFGTTSIIEFSPDNTLLAFVKFNEKDVDEFSFPYYQNQLYPTSFDFKYPKAGRKNSEVECFVFDIDNKTSRAVELPSSIEYIPKIDFFPDSNDLAIFTLNREQNDFSLYKTNPKSLIAKKIIDEKNDAYINSELLHNAKILDDGRIIYLSEKKGFKQIYILDNSGIEIKELTPSQYDVTDILAFNDKTGDLFFQAASVSPLEREIFKVNINDSKIKKISTKKGTNRAVFSEKGKYFINYYSDYTTPQIITLNDGKNGEEIKIFENNESLNNILKNFDLPKKEFTTFKAADQKTDLNAYIIKPSDFNPNKKYPVVMIQYSGPDSQQVLNRFELGWEFYLAQQGYIVVCVDGRGTGARGEKFRKQTYMNLGILESDDQIAAAHQLAKIPFIEENKIGIWGWSFGGYNTLMSMSRGDNIIKTGVAIAPVTDWKFYDTVYGERFMRTPQQNESGYKNGSPIELIDNLQGNVLLVHGSADDNVHVQNTMEYLKAAIEANKDVDLFIFPDKDHSITGVKNRNYIYNKVIKYFDNNLK